MKTFKLTYLLLLVLALSTFGCSNDDNGSEVIQFNVQDLTNTIDENPTNGQSIGTIDTDGDGSLNFSISSQTPTGALIINASTGELTIADATVFDFETNPVLTAIVAVSGTTNTGTVTINLNDLDEISTQDLTVAVDENPTDGQVVGSIQVTGAGTLDFSITSQTPAGALSINATTGELSVVDPNLFDFETNPVITVDISVDNSVYTVQAVATINLNDVDEIVVQSVTPNIDENPTNGDVIGTLPATSANSLTYTITFQNPAGAVSINQNTGELSVADATLFDYETNPNMLAVVSVDNGVYSVSANVAIDIHNLNEVGDFNYGGVIFWIDPSSNNSSGLVISTTDQGTAPWGCNTIDISGAQDTAIGTGVANTLAIEAGCTTPGTATDIASGLDLNGYDDWFLGSVFEMYEVYLNIAVINSTLTANSETIISANNSYWTSTQQSISNARFLGASNGSLNGTGKNGLLQVRAIRSWTDF